MRLHGFAAARAVMPSAKLDKSANGFGAGGRSVVSSPVVDSSS
jgi:hypothetical protein